MTFFKKNTYYFLILIFFLSGCATVQETSPEKILTQMPELVPIKIVQGVDVQEEIQPEVAVELSNIEDEPVEVIQQKKGVIFAKTDFQGVLKTSYVKLLFEDQNDPENKLQLYIGDKSKQIAFPWEVKTVEPGYFFIELPEGKYKITQVVIPVGSTTAEETLDINLEVIADTISYIGTLQMIGTKEKIKLGGVPLIKPGFEYTVAILDEHVEGQAIFIERYPDVTQPVNVKLMWIGANK
ncbi:hypothetical protein MNBD_UNCLBAC01-2116 [hydrothermal vent metagenome]|uniref:Lipoprotein n=1 Tax=hydrothermal vent metagenome TaxID=652676 RepID=A0A3B1DE63_9ZZZZ